MLHYNPSRLSLERAPSVIVVCCDVPVTFYCIDCNALYYAGTQFLYLCFNEGRFVPSNCTSCFCTHFVVKQSSNLHCILNVGPGNREMILVCIMKAYGGAEVLLHSFLTSVGREGEPLLLFVGSGFAGPTE
jgi:hypothetical protein